MEGVIAKLRRLPVLLPGGVRVLLAKRLRADCGGLPVAHWMMVFGEIASELRVLSLGRGRGLPSIKSPFKRVFEGKPSCHAPWRPFFHFPFTISLPERVLVRQPL
jgi:hypothetical protein